MFERRLYHHIDWAMIGALAWIEEGTDYRIEGNPEFAAFVHEAAVRMLRATGPVVGDGGSSRKGEPRSGGRGKKTQR